MIQQQRMSSEDLIKMKKMQLEMLMEFVRLCKENNIRYSIYAGTLLGAVRHKGYIPWDDDIDIAMLREDYEKFKKVAHKLNPDLCSFQDHDTDPEYRWGYGKLRRVNTTFIRTCSEHLKSKTGVFIDIFPFDDIPKSTLAQTLHHFYCFLLRKVLYSEVGRLSPYENIFTRAIYSCLSKIDVDIIFKQINFLASKSKNSSPNRVRILTFPPTRAIKKDLKPEDRYGVPKEWFLDLSEYEFEGLTLWGTKEYDSILKCMYGNYMNPPEIEECEGHAAYRYSL